MIKISELKFVENIFFRSNLTYNKSSLYQFISSNFKEEKLFDTDSLDLIEEQKNKQSVLAHDIILKKDLAAIRKGVKKEDLWFDEEKWNNYLPEIKEKIEHHLNLKFELKKINFCDKFPEGHEQTENKGASTITIFEGNKNAGIYYLNKRLDNTSTAIHIIHEQIHTALSQNKDKDQVFIEWLEEGIAIIYSIQIYYELTNDIDTIKAYQNRSYIYNNVKPEWDFTKRYYEYMKIMSKIFLSGGFDLIQVLLKKYLNKKRQEVNNYLTQIQNHELKINYIPKNEIENFIAAYSSQLEPEKITPLEYVIVKSLTKPKLIPDIAKEVNAPEEITKQALNNLFTKGICIMVKDNKIDIIWRKKDLFDHNLINPIYPM